MLRSHTFLIPGVALLLLICGSGPAQEGAEPALEVSPTAGDGVAVGVLHFRITGEMGEPIPGRLTFVGPGGPREKLFKNRNANPDDLAVRRNIVYSLSGSGRITVPVGSYTLHASRGLEWSVASRQIAIREGQEQTWIVALRREIDTSGWVSGDFHLHTLTHSGHGDSNMKERIISLVGEGVEFAVATDHNHHTDYGPTIRELKAGDELTAVTGNEVSVPVGHFNAFPLDPTKRPFDSGMRDARELFRLIREHDNGLGFPPIIQLNHPRWGGIDYFGQAALDPVTGTSDAAVYSDDFDSVEVFNENAGWGYYNADVERRFSVGAGVHSVLEDWFNLLNRGHRAAAVGNSDSHHVEAVLAGYPRNFVRSSTDDPSRIDVAEVAGALRERSVFTTFGPFVDFKVDGRRSGSSVTARGSEVELAIRVQAASWIDCDRVKIVVNGEVAGTIEVPDTREVLRLDSRTSVVIYRDSWIALLVEGDDPMAPIAHDTDRPVRPIAVVNPVWVDGDGDGRWTPPSEAARAIVEEAGSDPGKVLAAFECALSAERALLVLAATRSPGIARDLVPRGLADETRRVRLASARAAQQIAEPALSPSLTSLLRDPASDPYLALAALRALRATEPARFQGHLGFYLDRHGTAGGRRYGAELAAILPGQFVDEWMVIGYFPNGERDTLVKASYGPEQSADVALRYAGKLEKEIGWVKTAAREGGFLDLRALDPRKEVHENAIAYAQTWLHAPSERTVRYTLGTDDGCRLYLNGVLLHEDGSRHGARPLQQIGKLTLRAGWNRVLLKVENGSHAFGLYFRVLDDEVTWRGEKPEPEG